MVIEHVPTSSDRTLYFDVCSGRYFYAYLHEIELACAAAIESVYVSGECTLNEFYVYLGLEQIWFGDFVGWKQPLKVEFSPIMASSTLPAVAMTFRNMPATSHDRSLDQ